MYFIDRGIQRRILGSAGEPTGSASEERLFDVFCDGKAILRRMNLRKEVGENHPIVRKISGPEPNAQGKLLLEFIPVTQYATVSAIEVVPQ